MNNFNDILKKVEVEILEEKGSLMFFGLFFRGDLDGVGDLVIIANWIEEGNTREAVKYLINKFKSKEIDYTKYISNIVAFSIDDNFVSHLALALKKNKVEDSEKDMKLIKLFDDFIIKSRVFHEDFDEFKPITLQKRTLQKTAAF